MAAIRFALLLYWCLDAALAFSANLKRPSTPAGATSFERTCQPYSPAPLLDEAHAAETQAIESTGRRNFLGASLLLLGVTPLVSNAATAGGGQEEDLTTSLYNPDGSLKADVASEATFRTVSFRLSTTGESAEAIDGKPKGSTTSGESEQEHVLVSYQLPDKWTNEYTENGIPVCRRISVYKVNQGNSNLLSKATKIGVTKALETARIGLNQADLMSGGSRDGYYDFDLAVAPKTCESSNDNLGLGFCPYDDIYLLTATNVGDQVYVFSIEATKDEWKRANADIRRVRRSFRIEEA